MKLTPAVIQDARTGEVLTLAYMSEESLQKTRETGETWLWSRSRNELWHKGATSGNTQRVIAALSETRERLVSEIADLVFHVSVLMADEGIDWSEVEGELASREK